ncbi:MAG: hypothetical protein R2780_02780 [Crocinitomicaceae bacterium]|nr:hypothetical protein [Crocinitomicaceae bacterium]
MPQITVENIEKALRKIDGLEEEALDKLIETYTLQQQPLVDYILQAGMEYQNEDLNVYAIYYFAVMCEAIYQQGLSLNGITEDDIEAFQEPFLMALEAIHDNEDYEPMEDLIKQHNMQQFMIEEVESPDSDGVMLDEETQTQLFIVTTSMIGLLNQAIKS